MPQPENKPARTLHDRIFKEFLHRFLPDFLQIFFPEEAERLDFATLTFPDQELIVNLPNQTLRITDIVAEVTTFDGETETIIVRGSRRARHPGVATADVRVLRAAPFVTTKTCFACRFAANFVG